MQVSMNLTDFERTPLDQVLDVVRTEAARRQVEIEGVQYIGLVPRKAIGDKVSIDPNQVLEAQLQ